MHCLHCVETDESSEVDIDKLTNWLVHVIRQIECRQNIQHFLTDEIRVWWVKYKELEDQKRRDEEEQAKRDEIILARALDKLTEYEKKLIANKFSSHNLG